MGESGSRLITICNACTANGRDVKARQRAMPYLLPPVRQMRSAAEQCSGEVTIRAASSRSPRPQSAVLSCWSGKARQGRVASRSIAFGTDRSLRHRVSSDPISQPQTKSPSSTLARPAGIVLSLSLSLPPSLFLALSTLPCPLDLPFSARPHNNTIPPTAAPQRPLLQQPQPTCTFSPIAHPLTGTSLVRWLDSASHRIGS
jgi:hypothetical protein